MIISVQNSCPLRFFPMIDSLVSYHPLLHRKFLLKCKGINEQSDITVTPLGDGDITIKCSATSAKRPKVLFAANRDDLIRYTEEYDEKLDIYPVYCMDFKPIKFKLPDRKIEWVIFTSKRAFDFFTRSGKLQYLCGKKIGTIGEKTAQFISKYGIGIDLVPESFVSSELIKQLTSETLIVTAKAHSNIYEKKRLEVIEVYENVLPKESYAYRYDDCFQYALFSSPSAFKNTIQINGKGIVRRINNIIAIGPTTKKAIESFGAECIMPTKFTIESMFNLIEEDQWTQQQNLKT